MDLPQDFDWAAWMDAERQAAADRTGAVDGTALALDPRYARALDILARRERALRSLAQSEVEARGMATGVDKPSGGRS